MVYKTRIVDEGRTNNAKSALQLPQGGTTLSMVKIGPSRRLA